MVIDQLFGTWSIQQSHAPRHVDPWSHCISYLENASCPCSFSGTRGVKIPRFEQPVGYCFWFSQLYFLSPTPWATLQTILSHWISYETLSFDSKTLSFLVKRATLGNTNNNNLVYWLIYATWTCRSAALIERAQFALNKAIYTPGAIEFNSATDGRSFLEYFLWETEKVHG